MATQPPSGTTVRVRFRPRSSKETETRCVDYTSETQISFQGPEGSRNLFTFDKVYGEATSQADVFQDLEFVVHATLQGYNGTIMAYGQTGSGKTHSLIGSVNDPDQHGVVPRAVQCLADGIAAETGGGGGDEGGGGADFEVGLSVVEIYCERVRDLLDGSKDNLQVKQDAGRGVYIDGATEIIVSNEQQLVTFMHEGLAQRSVAATSMNETSSRSHCIVMVRVDKTLVDGTLQRGKLVMVDLAGSERADRTNATGAMLVEGSQINKSLSCLANVIYALTADPAKKHHVPYRDSKLTRVLQDSLGGTAKTVLIICCSPCMDNAAETVSSLRFGSRAKGVQNTVQVNQRLSPDKLLQQVELLKARNAELAAQLATALAAAGGTPLPPSPALPAAEGTSMNGAGSAAGGSGGSQADETSTASERSMAQAGCTSGSTRSVDGADHQTDTAGGACRSLTAAAASAQSKCTPSFSALRQLLLSSLWRRPQAVGVGPSGGGGASGDSGARQPHSSAGSKAAAAAAEHHLAAQELSALIDVGAVVAAAAGVLSYGLWEVWARADTAACS